MRFILIYIPITKNDCLHINIKNIVNDTNEIFERGLYFIRKRSGYYGLYSFKKAYL